MKIYFLEVTELISYDGKSYDRGGEWTERFDSEEERQARIDDLVPEGGTVRPAPDFCVDSPEFDIWDDEEIWVWTVRLTEEEKGA